MEIKPTYFLTVYKTLDDLKKGLNGDFIEVFGRLASDKPTRNKGLGKGIKYIPPTYEILNTISLSDDPYDTVYEVKCSGSNREEFNIHGWVSHDSYLLGTRKQK